jgi:uncharacterized tellurite resistance protein B-like protein
MVLTIKKFFEKYINPSPHGSEKISEHYLQVATSALLIEMMKADANVSENERKTVIKIIRSKFNLTEDEIGALLQLAEEEIWKSTGYYEFTSLINKGFTYKQKVTLIEHLWEVAFTDRRLDKHEEYMVRKIADLIYVEHKDFIEAKLRVKKKFSL